MECQSHTYGPNAFVFLSRAQCYHFLVVPGWILLTTYHVDDRFTLIIALNSMSHNA